MFYTTPPPTFILPSLLPIPLNEIESDNIPYESITDSVESLTTAAPKPNFHVIQQENCISFYFKECLFVFYIINVYVFLDTYCCSK